MPSDVMFPTFSESMFSAGPMHYANLDPKHPKMQAPPVGVPQDTKFWEEDNFYLASKPLPLGKRGVSMVGRSEGFDFAMTGSENDFDINLPDDFDINFSDDESLDTLDVPAVENNTDTLRVPTGSHFSSLSFDSSPFGSPLTAAYSSSDNKEWARDIPELKLERSNESTSAPVWPAAMAPAPGPMNDAKPSPDWTSAWSGEPSCSTTDATAMVPSTVFNNGSLPPPLEHESSPVPDVANNDGEFDASEDEAPPKDGKSQPKKRGRARRADAIVKIDKIKEINVSLRALSDLPSDLYNIQNDDLVTCGKYSKAVRRAKIERFKLKWEQSRLADRKIMYRCRKKFADKRPRVGGRFVKSVPTPG